MWSVETSSSASGHREGSPCVWVCSIMTSMVIRDTEGRSKAHAHNTCIFYKHMEAQSEAHMSGRTVSTVRIRLLHGITMVRHTDRTSYLDSLSHVPPSSKLIIRLKSSVRMIEGILAVAMKHDSFVPTSSSCSHGKRLMTLHDPTPENPSRRGLNEAAPRPHCDSSTEHPIPRSSPARTH